MKADVADGREQVKKARADLAAVQSMKECQLAVESFTPESLGDSHVRGGTAAHVKNRMDVLDRVARHCGALTPQQTNDWKWFKEAWDKNAQMRWGQRGAWLSLRQCRGF